MKEEDKLYHKIQEFAVEKGKLTTNIRRAEFSGLLQLVADAVQDIEAVDSGALKKGEEFDSIDKVFDFFAANADRIRKATKFDILTALFKEVDE